MEVEKIEYYFSKIAISIAAILLFSILFLIAFFTYIGYSADFKVAAVIGLIIFILFLTLFPALYKRVRFFLADIPALILTKDKLIDNINSQTFNWTDIKNISSKSIQLKTRVNYIAVSLLYPEKYIGIIRSPYKRLIARLNQKYFGGAFSIQPNIIKCDNKELLKTLTKYFHEYK